MSAFMVGRVIGSWPLGILSDEYGRRPVIELGLWSCIVFQALFGLSSSFWMACVMRFLMGTFNGIIGVSKAWLPELVPAEHQSLAMSLIAGMWGLGQVIGPAFGGILAGTGFEQFPYLLPNLAGAALAIAALVAVRTNLPGGKLTCAGWRRRRTASELAGTSLASSDSAVEAAAAAEEHKVVVASGRDGAAGAAGAHASLAHRCLRCLGVPSSSIGPLFIYALHSLACIFYEEIYPLWLVSPVNSGGLGWSPSEAGILLGAGGAFLALSQFVVFPLLSKRVPSTVIFKGCEASLVVFVLLTPIVPLAGTTMLVPLLVLVSAAIKGLASCGFTACFLIINDSCHKDQRGRVNGLGMSLSSTFKAIGPALGAVCFAWSLTNGVHGNILLDFHFAFWLCGALTALAFIVAQRSFTAQNNRPLALQSPPEVKSTKAPSSSASKEEGSQEVIALPSRLMPDNEAGTHTGSRS